MSALHPPLATADCALDTDFLISQIFNDIDAFGWAVTNVSSAQDKSRSRFCYTTGFTLTLGVPEVVGRGEDYWWMSTLINCVGTRLRCLPPDERLQAFTDGSILRDLLLDGREVAFRPLGSYEEAGCLQFAASLLGQDVPVVQLLVSDRDNHLPTSPACDPAVARGQKWPPWRD